MQIQATTAVKLVLSELENLDPITVFIEDLAPGKGKITISCYGKSWSAYWGAMGDTVADFVARVSSDYLIDSLAPGLYPTRFSGDELVKAAKRKTIEARRLRLWSKREAREVWQRIEDDLTEITRESDVWQRQGTLRLALGDDYLDDCRAAGEPNPDYDYLRRIVEAVKAGLKQLGAASTPQLLSCLSLKCRRVPPNGWQYGAHPQVVQHAR